jgi:predicted Zn-dependent peptidase
MISYKEHTLGNGLRVLAHRDRATQMAAVNIAYKVGARDEDPSHTGFAHLFEHLMFRGTRRVPHFDVPVQEAAGENNAFTNNDYTNYYITLPVTNVETALWLEADRMTGLAITPAALEAEKKVVIEEFNQRYLNQPYGDMWLLLRAMAYKVHPYRWPTIGLEPAHIAKATLEQVREFYKRWYTPSNAILSVAADMAEEEVFALAEKYFGGVVGPKAEASVARVEPPQTEPRRMEVRRPLPATSVTIAFHMSGRPGREFYVCDMISDILGGGASARLNQRLAKERRLFSAVNAYVTGDLDPGLIVVTGYLNEGVTHARGEEALWDELRRLQNEPVGDYELEKVKNKFEANTLLGELNVMNKAMNLGFYALLGDMSLLNGEVGIYRSIAAAEIAAAARRVFTPANSSTLIYIAE